MKIYQWPLVDPWLTLGWPLADPYLTPGWPPGEPCMTPWWPPADPGLTPTWPLIDPWLTPWWPLVDPLVNIIIYHATPKFQKAHVHCACLKMIKMSNHIHYTTVQCHINLKLTLPARIVSWVYCQWVSSCVTRNCRIWCRFIDVKCPLEEREVNSFKWILSDLF